ncbi:MAG: LPS export ABC transporter periplasmic protein LptC [Prevotella sp.]|nr:LPS export ABC transporter periplasmic protein LptC [Prevotella sp.]
MSVGLPSGKLTKGRKRIVLATVRRLTIIPFCALLVLVACSEQQEHTAPAVHDRDSASMMTSYGVNTLISDSGVIKYKIVTERWDVNTIKNPPRWTFEKGIFMEQFDEQFHIEGYIQADTAWYYDQQKLWELRGRVYIRNVNGLLFRSEELFWDGIKHEFYSYKFSRVVTPERTLEGTYFRSDEHMAHYEVTNSVGSFQTSDMEPEPQQPAPASSAASTPADTAQPAPPVRQAATRRAATQKNVYRP